LYITHRFGEIGRRFCIVNVHAALARYRPRRFTVSEPCGPRVPHTSEGQASNRPAPKQAESAPNSDYRGAGERLEAVEHGSYAPDGPLGTRKHSSASRLLEPFTTGCGCLRYASRVSYVRMCKPPAKCQAVRSGTVIYERAIVPYITCDVSQLLSVTTNES
jgi:hypothetical protein